MNNKPKAFLGIDPGRKGFVALWREGVTDNNGYTFFAFPLLPLDKINEYGYKQLLEQIKPYLVGYDVKACIENVYGRSDNSGRPNPKTAFAFGFATGMQKLILILLDIADIEKVLPQAWQKAMYSEKDKVLIKGRNGKMKHDTKATSIKIAQQLAPEIDFRRNSRARVMSDDKTDAFLICEWFKKQY